MRKWYGSINNRVDEGHQYCEKIEVGTGMTEYMWSDRHAYEVTKVINQNHVFVRRLEAIRTDHNGMSECQDYEYKQNPNAAEIEIVKRYNAWYVTSSYNKKEMEEEIAKRFANGTNLCRSVEAEMNYFLAYADFTDKQKADFNNGKTIKKYKKWNNISFGVLDEYYDYSF